MKKIWWIGGAVVVVVLALLVGGPWAYGKFIAEDDAPAAVVSTEGAEAASGSIDGQWTVVAGQGGQPDGSWVHRARDSQRIECDRRRNHWRGERKRGCRG